MVSIRLSEDEYAALHRASLTGGARSVSDFARDILFSILERESRTAVVAPPPKLVAQASSSTDHPIHLRLEQLAGDLQALNDAVRELRGQLNTTDTTENHIIKGVAAAR